jgi:hypothetical protein
MYSSMGINRIARITHLANLVTLAFERMRECYSCGSNKTYVDKTKKGTPYESWNGNGIENQWLCHKCNNKYITNPQSHLINNTKLMCFTPLKKILTLEEDPRIGVCNFCRAVRGIDCKQTHMHHDNDRYDVTNPLKYAIELCVSCHRKEGKITNETRLKMSIAQKRRFALLT